MSVTEIDAKVALVVIDLQKGIMTMAGPHGFSDVIAKTSMLLKTFRECDLPVVLVNVGGKPSGRTENNRNLSGLPSDWLELIPELDQQPDDHLVTKHSAGAFTNTDLEDYLKGKKVTQVVIAGVSTSMGVEATARHAYELGFNVVLAIDAMTDPKAECHEHSVHQLFPRIAETGTSDEIITKIKSTINEKVRV